MEEIQTYVLIITLLALWILHRLNDGPVPFWRFLAYASLSAAFSHSFTWLIDGSLWRIDWYLIPVFVAVLLVVPVAVVAGIYALIFGKQNHDSST